MGQKNRLSEKLNHARGKEYFSGVEQQKEFNKTNSDNFVIVHDRTVDTGLVFVYIFSNDRKQLLWESTAANRKMPKFLLITTQKYFDIAPSLLFSISTANASSEFGGFFCFFFHLFCFVSSLSYFCLIPEK